MRFVRKLLEFAFRAFAWTLSALSVVLILFVGGYWLGWKATPGEPEMPGPVAEIAPTGTPTSSKLAASTSPLRTRPRVDATRDRVARLARLDAAHMQAELALLDLNQVQSVLAALEHAPASRPFVGLRFCLLERWASLDPQGALDYARGVPNENSSSALVSAVLRRWAFFDPQAALAAWREVVPASAGDEIRLQLNSYYGLRDMFWRLGARDWDRALIELGQLPAEHQREAWRGLATLVTKEEHRERLLTALTALPPGEARTGALAEAVELWARSGNRDGALQWLESAQLGRAVHARTEERIAAADFREGNRQEAADWLVGQAQSSQEREKRIEKLVSMWGSEDPVGAGEWLIAQGLDASASRAMSKYAWTVSANHPVEAVAWARSIQDERVRQSTLEQVEKRIRQYHPNRADALLAPESTSQ